MKSIIYIIVAVFMMVSVAVAGENEITPEDLEAIAPILEDIDKICGKDEDCMKEQIASAIALSKGIEAAQNLPEDQTKYIILGVFDQCAFLTMTDDLVMNFSEMRLCVNTAFDVMEKELDKLALEIKKEKGV